MKRLHPHKIDDAKYYEHIWGEEVNVRPYYDAVRQRELLGKVKDGDKVLDVGAGVYGACQYAKENGIDIDAYCVDQSYTARDIVEKMELGIKYELSDVLEIPFADNTFDVVIAGELIEHIENPQDLVDEIARVCKPGGWLTISTVDTKSENAKKKDYPEHLWEFTPRDLLEMFNKVGEAEHYYLGDYHIVNCRVK